jgi:PAS domain S-box-containing protein
MGAIAAGAPPKTHGASRLREVGSVQWLHVSFLVCAAAVAVAGLTTHLLHRDLLSPFPGATPFAANVAVALCALTAAAVLDGHRTARVLGGVAALLGGLTLLQHLTGADLGIDRLFFDPYRATSVTGHPGRMAPNTSTAILAAGLGVVLRGRVAVALLALASLIGLIAALGYTDPKAQALSSIGQGVNMALPTALGVTFVAVALLLGREHDYFARPSVGGTLTRRLAAAVILFPGAGAVMLISGTQAGWFSEPVGVWFLTVATTLAGLATLLWISTVADRQEEATRGGLSLQAETAANLTEGLCIRRESDGEVLSENAALQRIFGYAPGELVGTSRPLLTPEHEREMRKALRTAGSWTQEAQTVRADGELFWCSVKASAFEHPDHGLLRVSLYHDVTGRREADHRRRRAEAQRETALAELERSNKELEQFAHVASHDLSEPLRVIAGFVGLLQRRYEGQLDEDADRFIDATVSGVDRMQALIDALLAYSRAGADELNHERVDTTACVESALKVLAPRIEETGARVDVAPLPDVSGDPVLLERVFQNLLSNALKFTAGRAPHVRVEAEPAQAGLCAFRVADNGVGIAPEHAERVFAMFQRLQGRDQPGTGIGLSITRRIVERHGGQIWAEEAAEGGEDGAVIHFTVPEAPA